MKYNEKYDRWVTKDGLVYKYNKTEDKLVVCKLHLNNLGYLIINVSKPESGIIYVHRLVYETFGSKIPPKMVIDHINTIRTDNRLENLRCVTQKENNNNPLSLKHHTESVRGKIRSEFGRKFKEHFGISRWEDKKLYYREKSWYHYHNHRCSWE